MTPSEAAWPDPEPSPVQDAPGPDGEGSADRVGRLKKAPTAFRTISEVADDLHVPQHVLRFWETRFPQVKPLKRGGGRRYYRPDDVVLLRRISDLLYIQGYTIKGVQRLLVEGDGSLHGELPPPDAADIDDSAAAVPAAVAVEPAANQARAAEGGASVSGDGAGAPPGGSEDLLMLRAAFRETLSVILAELEAIRRQLPA